MKTRAQWLKIKVTRLSSSMLKKKREGESIFISTNAKSITTQQIQNVLEEFLVPLMTKNMVNTLGYFTY